MQHNHNNVGTYTDVSVKLICGDCKNFRNEKNFLYDVALLHLLYFAFSTEKEINATKKQCSSLITNTTKRLKVGSNFNFLINT
jgi:hypothetical protein